MLPGTEQGNGRSPRSVWALWAGLVILSAGAFAQAAPQPVADVAMEQPLDRRVVAIASHEGEVTLAGEVLSGRYDPEADLRTLCGSIDDASRHASPACLVIERFDAVRAGDGERLASLYRPDSERRTLLVRGEAPEFRESQVELAAVEAIRPTTQRSWGRYRLVDIAAVMNQDRTAKVPGSVKLVSDHQAERLWLTEDLSRLNYPIHSVPTGLDEDDQVLATAPAASTALRLEKVGGGDDERKVAAELLEPGGVIKATDLILYVKEQRFALDAPPLLDMDPAELDEAGKSLQESLDLLQRWSDGERISIDRLADLWHPAYRDTMRRSYEWARSNGVKISIRGAGDSAESLPELRVASRTFTENGIVWFAWYPADDAVGGASSLAILQLKDETGDYKLVASTFQTPSMGDRRAMRLLGGDNAGFSGVPEALTLRQRAEQVAETVPTRR